MAPDNWQALFDGQTRYTLEIEGQDKPACVAETVVLLLS